jgi:MFS family permease
MADALAGKVARRLLPFLMLCYFFAYLDRVNVGFAALTMNRDLGLSATAYGFGAGLFFLGYVAFEVPSNLILERVGARIWIARIMVTWSLISASTAFVTSEWSFYLVRVLLGLAEAGFFPGIILYLTYGFPTAQRAGIVGIFMMAVPLSAAIGAPLSGLVMSFTDGWLGLAGWQWLYLLEAAPSLLLGLATLFVLTDRPEQAAWLTPEERVRLVARMAEDQRLQPNRTTHFGSALLDPRVLGLGLVYFGLSTGLYAVGLWLPQIVSSFGFTTTATGFVTAIPYIVSAGGDARLDAPLRSKGRAGPPRRDPDRGSRPRPDRREPGRNAIPHHRRAQRGGVGGVRGATDLLDAADAVAHRNRGRGRHCTDQCSRQSRRLRRTVAHGLGPRRDRAVRRRIGCRGRGSHSRGSIGAAHRPGHRTVHGVDRRRRAGVRLTSPGSVIPVAASFLD